MTGPVVVVTGVPGSGKTTLAAPLARELGWPLLAKDTIKEALFDILGSGDLDFSRTLGQASHSILLALAAAQEQVIVESFFWPGTAEKPLIGMRRPLIQVFCDCPMELAVRRYRARITDPSRHPGHALNHQSDEVIAAWAEVAPLPLDLPGPVHRVDTSSPVDISALAAAVLDDVG